MSYILRELPKHRYYELKHLCLQYPEWIKLVDRERHQVPDGMPRGTGISDPTFQEVAYRLKYYKRIEMVEKAALVAGDLSDYILHGVTEGRTYEQLQLKYGIPCCRETYYRLYKLYFMELDRLRE